MTGERTIVVVEDDPNIADLVELYLRRDGFRVVQAADGETGMQRIGQNYPCLVVLDLGLPGELDGLEVCRRLRESRPVPTIMLTALYEALDRPTGGGQMVIQLPEDSP